MIPPMSPNGQIMSPPSGKFVRDIHLSSQSELDRARNSGCKRCCLKFFVLAYLLCFTSI